MTSVLTTAIADSPRLAEALDSGKLLVVSLCAAWCGTCTEFRVMFERLAASRPDAAFVWLDVDSDAQFAGEIDVEDFPTLAIYHHGDLRHFGVSLPNENLVARLIASLSKGRQETRAANSPPSAAHVHAAQLPNLMRAATSVVTAPASA